MKKHILYLIIHGLFCSTSLLAGEQVPWQDPQISGINREPACAYFVSFPSEAKALSNDVQANERRVSLDGIWKFLYSRNIDACPKNFFKPDFSPNGYWRGPIWLDQVYFAIHGLRNYGYTELADGYTKQVFDRLNGLRADAPIHENYETSTGKRLKSPHFSWSAAHLLLLHIEPDESYQSFLSNYTAFQNSFHNLIHCLMTM